MLREKQLSTRNMVNAVTDEFWKMVSESINDQALQFKSEWEGGSEHIASVWGHSTFCEFPLRTYHKNVDVTVGVLHDCQQPGGNSCTGGFVLSVPLTHSTYACTVYMYGRLNNC